ncbi:MAG: hypothetical protein ACI9G1_004929 [Pirellulaceae bacterium]|jgi:hypothetical protein
MQIYILRILSVVLVTILATVLSAEENRTAQNYMWRFDGSGRFQKIDPPDRWQNNSNILWKTSVEIGGYSSPIVVNDRNTGPRSHKGLLDWNMPVIAHGRMFIRTPGEIICYDIRASVC